MVLSSVNVHIYHIYTSLTPVVCPLAIRNLVISLFYQISGHKDHRPYNNNKRGIATPSGRQSPTEPSSINKSSDQRIYWLREDDATNQLKVGPRTSDSKNRKTWRDNSQRGRIIWDCLIKALDGTVGHLAEHVQTGRPRNA